MSIDSENHNTIGSYPGPDSDPNPKRQKVNNNTNNTISIPSGDLGIAPNIVCSLLGTVPLKPVISKQGYIYERSAIEAYLETNGRFCPFTNEPMSNISSESNTSSSSSSDLIEIKRLPSQIPLAPYPNSIPNLIQCLRQDVDACLLDNYQTRAEAKGLKEELSTALYTEDAAVRLLVRLQKENAQLVERNQMLVERNEDIQQQLQQYQSIQNLNSNSNTVNNNNVAVGNTNGTAATSTNTSGSAVLTKPEDIPAYPHAEFLAEVKSFEEKFRVQRKEMRKRKDLAEIEEKILVKPEELSNFQSTAAIPLHSTVSKGIRCISLHPQHDNLIVTAGVDGCLIVFHREKKRQICQLKTQLRDPKPVTSLAVSGDTIVSGSLDGLISIFQMNNKEDWTRGYVKISSIKNIHKKEITNLVFHPNETYVLASSKDRSWSVFSKEGDMVCHSKNEQSEVTSCDYHPGGGMIAIGRADGSLEVKSLNVPDASQAESIFVNTKQASHDGVSSLGSIRSIAFHSNCTTLAAAHSSGVVTIWHLKNDPKLMQKITTGADRVSRIRFGPVSMSNPSLSTTSSPYLAICSQALSIYYQDNKNKDLGYQLVKTFTDHGQTVTDVAMGRDGQIVCSVSMDRDLRVYQGGN